MGRKVRNRILSMILCGAMAVGMLPASVWAQEEISTEEELIQEAEAGTWEESSQEEEDGIAESLENAPEEVSADMETEEELSDLTETEEESLGLAETEEELSDFAETDESEFFEDQEDFVLDIEEMEAEETLPLEADAVSEGSCGLNGAPVSWKLTDGVLTISGSGAMDDYITLADWSTGTVISSNVQPWISWESQISEVVIENGVTVIGYAAFADLYNLKKVTIASSVKQIRHDAFANCTSLSEINMGSGVETLESDVFYGAAVVSLTLPKSLKTMDPFALVGLWSAENIYVESGNSVYQSKDGVLFQDGGGTLVYYPMNRKGAYTVPAGTEKIAVNAFSQSVITSISIPDSVTEIGESAFYQCTQLTGITFPKNLKVIERYVCMGDTALQSVTIPEGVTTIRSWAFWDCSSLKSVTIPASINTIENAFPKETSVTSANPNMYRQEDGSFIDAVRVNVSVKEEYQKAFEVLDLVNQEREKAGVEKLVMDASLLETAMLRASETVLYWSHTRPSGSNCFTANSLMFGENIAYGSSTASGVMDMWMNSQGHKANILSSSYGSIGVGCVYHEGVYYWVQCFGSKVSSVANASSYSDKTVNRSIAVKKDEEYYKASFKLSKTSLTVGDTAEVEVDWAGSKLTNSGAVIESSNPSVCIVSEGTITAVGAGSAEITCYFSGYPEKAAKINVTVTKGKAIKITYNANGGKVKQKSKTVTQNAAYGTLASPTRKGYTFSGWYTAKKGGKKITSSSIVTASKNMTLYARWKKVTVKTASIQKLTNAAGKKMTVKIKKCSGAEGYQIVYATNSKFTKGKKTVNVTKTSKDITKLKKGKTYYVKVRAYKKDSTGKKVYGKYSKVKKVRIKK